jgi:hypothetical protein
MSFYRHVGTDMMFLMLQLRKLGDRWDHYLFTGICGVAYFYLSVLPNKKLYHLWEATSMPG